MTGLLMRFADNRRADTLAARLRRRRLALLEALIEGLPRPVRLLDVGGTAGFWEVADWRPADVRIVLLNRAPDEPRQAGPAVVAGDARDLGQFADSAFDVVFSNSVIEHVGDVADQQRMADEIVRVGRRYLVQTPNRTFPIEMHFLVPFFQFLPVAIQASLIQRFDLGWYRRVPDRSAALELVRSHYLLTATDLQRLFPAATIHRERVLGLTKSLIAVGGTE